VEIVEGHFCIKSNPARVTQDIRQEQIGMDCYSAAVKLSKKEKM
jgi:hypothetical protein